MVKKISIEIICGGFTLYNACDFFPDVLRQRFRVIGQVVPLFRCGDFVGQLGHFAVVLGIHQLHVILGNAMGKESVQYAFFLFFYLSKLLF